MQYNRVIGSVQFCTILSKEEVRKEVVKEKKVWTSRYVFIEQECVHMTVVELE